MKDTVMTAIPVTINANTRAASRHPAVVFLCGAGPIERGECLTTVQCLNKKVRHIPRMYKEEPCQAFILNIRNVQNNPITLYKRTLDSFRIEFAPWPRNLGKKIGHFFNAFSLSAFCFDE